MSSVLSVYQQPIMTHPPFHPLIWCVVRNLAYLRFFFSPGHNTKKSPVNQHNQQADFFTDTLTCIFRPFKCTKLVIALNDLRSS